MTLDLGPQALVNAGGGLAYVLVGVLAAASRGGGRARVALAAGAVAFGAAFVLANV